jgi:translation initiation factor IF-1
MPADSEIEAWGTVVDVLPGGTFRVKLDEGDGVVLAHLSGKMRINSIRVVLGDKVLLGLSAYDLTRGRILRRSK